MSNDRVKKLRAKNLDLKRKRWEVSITDAEKVELKAKLTELRKSA
jgi:hypothetical protein